MIVYTSLFDCAASEVATDGVFAACGCGDGVLRVLETRHVSKQHARPVWKLLSPARALTTAGAAEFAYGLEDGHHGMLDARDDPKPRPHADHHQGSVHT